MRSLLVRLSITVFTILLLGSGITLAAASSEPGMFLYPVKKMTQKATGAFQGTTDIQAPSTPLQDDAVPEPVITESSDNSPVEDISDDGAPESVDFEDTDVDQSTDIGEPTQDASAAVDMINRSSVDQGDAVDTPAGNLNDDSNSDHDQAGDVDSPDDSQDDSSSDHDQADDVDSPDDSQDDASSSPDDLTNNDDSGDDSSNGDHNDGSHDDGSHDDDSHVDDSNHD